MAGNNGEEKAKLLLLIGCAITAAFSFGTGAAQGAINEGFYGIFALVAGIFTGGIFFGFLVATIMDGREK